MSRRDERDDANDFESTDWLLAQLGQGRRPDLEGRDMPAPAAEPPVEPPAEPVVPSPPAPARAAEPPEPRAPRSEETLDWFSLAEPAPSSSDAATRALPVVGEPIEPREQPAAPPAPVAGPAWTSPAGVRPPVLPRQPTPPIAEPPSRLTSVEPPVGPGAEVPGGPPDFPPAPPVSAPTEPPAAVPAPTTPSTPPGPVTPPASFALTWGEPQIDSEAGLRAAFRQLADPAAPSQPSSPTQAEPAASAPDGPAVPSHPQPPAAAPVPPVAPAASVAPPRAESAPPPPSQSPGSAPPSWDDLAAAAAARSSGHTDPFADELWSALHEPASPPAPEEPAPPAPAAPPPAFEAFGDFAASGAAPPVPAAPLPDAEPQVDERFEPAPPQSAPPQPAPPLQPAAWEPARSEPDVPQAQPPQQEPRGRFAAFAEDFEAPVAPPPVFEAPTAAPAPPAPSAPTSPASPFTPPTRAPFEPSPFEPQQPAHQSFTPAPFGNPTAFAGSAPVDDLLAALGGGLPPAQGDRGSFGQSSPDDDVAPARGPLPPMTGPIPSGFSALGLALGSAAHGRRDAEPDDGSGDESSIAREIAETGYFWNLTPDPGGVDPKAPADVSDVVDDQVPGPRRSPAAAHPSEPEPEEFDPFAAVLPAGDPAAPDTDPFGLRGVFGDEREQVASSSAAASAAAGRDASLPTAAMPAAGPNAAAHDPLASLFGPGPDVVDAARPGDRPGAATVGAARPVGGGGGPTGPRPSGGSGSAGSGGGRSPVTVLAWIAGGLVAVLVLVGLFFLGTQLTGGAQNAASESPSPSESTPEAAPEPTAPQPAGVHAWNTLFGGECLDPFTDPWAEEFTVVDCAAPHAAQLVYRGTLPGDAAAPFPGEAALAEQMPALCSAAGVIDLAAAGGLTDLQVQGTYPVTEEQWAEGERTYYCFANRSSGEPLTAGIQGPGPAV